MAITVNTNIASLNAQNKLLQTNKSLGSVFERISSGMRINRAADDAAGLAVSENLDSERRALAVAARNANDAISVLQTAEGGVSEIGNIVKRMRELAVQSSSETLASDERSFIQTEFVQLSAEIDRISNSFNEGAVTGAIGEAAMAGDVTVQIQIGTSSSTTSQLAFKLHDTRAEGLGVSTSQMNLSTTTAALAALTSLDSALSSVNTARADIGAVQNRLESVLRNLMTYTENVNAAYSQIRDADFAYETAQMAKFQILQQSGVAVLGQANALSQMALRLIG